jgi:hypothetical protein
MLLQTKFVAVVHLAERQFLRALENYEVSNTRRRNAKNNIINQRRAKFTS